MGVLGLHGGVFEVLESAGDEVGVDVDALDRAFHSGAELDLSVYDVVFIQHLQTVDRERCRDLLEAAWKANPDLHVLSVSGLAESQLPELTRKGLIESDPQVAQYYRFSGRQNLRRLLLHTLATRLGREVEVGPPIPPPEASLYHPAHGGPFEGVDAFLAWTRDRDVRLEEAPRVAVIAHHIHRLVQQPRVVGGLVGALEQRGLLAAVVEDNAKTYRETLLALDPEVVVHTCHGFDDATFREELGVPHLHSIFFRRRSIEEWASSDDGLDPGDIAFQITSQELFGAIEPRVGAGPPGSGGGADEVTPIAEQIERIAERVAAWVHLRGTSNGEKRVALVYYDREMGKAELMRGSATGMFLNAPRSMVEVLARMSREGYSLSNLPADEDELLGWMLDHGRQIGAWDPEGLDRLARSGRAVLVPAETYRSWFAAKVPEARRQELVERWGEPPGRIQVWRDERGEEFLVLPVVDLGGVILLPQPLRGEAHDTSLVHDRLVPPSHNYLATYFWLQSGFRADAVVHFGTHGTEFLLPGKGLGLAADDWGEIVLGAMPNVVPWVVNNLGESSPARRRASAVLIGHMVPPSVEAELSDELENLHDDIDKWERLDEGALREKFRTAITRTVRETHLDGDLGLDLRDGRVLTAEEIGRTSEYLHAIHNETTPTNLHVLGQPPPRELVIPYLVTCLGSRFLDALGAVVPVPPEEDRFGGDRDKVLRRKAEEALELTVHRGLSPAEAVEAIGGGAAAGGLPKGLREGFELAAELNEGLTHPGGEIDNLLAALEGRFVPPGPGNSPDRNPSVLPTGRNIFVMNPEEVPTRPSWEIGKALVDQLLAQQLESKGRYPRKVGFTLNSFATFQDYGVMESQILYLMGIRPLWDARNRVVDVELIPREELGRPRIDVFIAALSYYRDMLPSRMRLLDEAVRLVASVDEADNLIFKNTARVRAQLEERGVAPDEARVLAFARMFGYPPGQMGSAGYYYLVERSGEWDTDEDLMRIYLGQVQHAYTEGLWGEDAPEAYEMHIQGTEVLLRSWSDRTRSPLSNKYDWYIGGSLSRAIQYLTGEEPEFILSDVRDPDRARLVDAEAALRMDYRVRLFNRKWIEGMMREGYAGADQIAKHVSNTMGWSIMRENAVDDDLWEEIVDLFVHDRLELGLRDWFEAENPFAYQELAEILLESIRKGYFEADDETRLELAREYTDSIARHGEGGGMLGGGNVKLEAFVEEILERAGGAPSPGPVAESHPPSPAEAEPAPGSGDRPATTVVEGHVLEQVEATSESGGAAAPRPLAWSGLLALALVGLGFRTRHGSPKR